MKTLFALVLSLAAAGAAHAQAFTNLGFEDATQVPSTPDLQLLSWSTAAPGWSHSAGDDTSLYYGSTHVGQTQWFLLTDAATQPSGVLAGAYSLQFSSGYSSPFPGNQQWVNAFVSQTGSVPTDALSLTLLARGPLGVTVNGTNAPLIALGGIAYGVDMSAYAGLTVELKFINTASTFFTPVTLDAIAFSASPVPEPEAYALMLAGLGVIGLVARRRRV